MMQNKHFAHFLGELFLHGMPGDEKHLIGLNLTVVQSNFFIVSYFPHMNYFHNKFLFCKGITISLHYVTCSMLYEDMGYVFTET